MLLCAAELKTGSTAGDNVSLYALSVHSSELKQPRVVTMKWEHIYWTKLAISSGPPWNNSDSEPDVFISSWVLKQLPVSKYLTIFLIYAAVPLRMNLFSHHILSMWLIQEEFMWKHPFTLSLLKLSRSECHVETFTAGSLTIHPHILYTDTYKYTVHLQFK